MGAHEVGELADRVVTRADPLLVPRLESGQPLLGQSGYGCLNERFVGEGSEDANLLLTRRYRAPFVVPETV